MTCEKVQMELVECWASTELLSTAAVEHLQECEGCRREALLLRETYTLLHSLPEERAPDGFTEGVLARIDQEQRQPGWLERLGGLLIPARTPSWARAAAVGAAIAIAVAGGTVLFTGAQQPAPQPQLASSLSPRTAAPGQTAAMASEAEFNELLVRHQAAEMTQPLADDAGVSLVVYTTD